MQPLDVGNVVSKASAAAFGKPLITNVLRGLIVEAIIALALEPDWEWCSADYASWDFQRSDGLRLEVKQSAYRQSWDTPATAKVSPGFDVKARTGRWEKTTFIAEPGRAADLYVLAYHDRRDEGADHRNPLQWEFFVLPATAIPPVARIALNSVRRLTQPVRIDNLASRVGAVAATIPRRRPADTNLR